MQIYRQAAIYAELLKPAEDLVADVDLWVETWLPGAAHSVCDPACGPGGWLEVFHRRGLRVAGNDLEAEMVREAKRRLARGAVELTVGDMRALRFQSGPFDFGVNLHASIGHLSDDASVKQHLRSMLAVLKPGGLYLLGATELSGRTDDTPETLWSSPPTALPGGGHAAILYESTRRDPALRREEIRVLLLTKGVAGVAPVVNESYQLLTFSAAGLRSLVEEAGFQILATHHMTVEGRPDDGLVPGAGDVTLILKRP